MVPYISADDLAAYLEETIDGFDLLTQIALDASCQLVRDDLDQTVNLVRDDLETLDGNSRETLILRELPVIAVSTVSEDGELLVEVDDYLVDTRRGMVHRVGAGWLAGRLNVEVTYDHGWATSEADVVEENSAGDPVVDRVPSSIRLVTLELAARIYKAPAREAVAVGGVTSETIGSYSYQADPGVIEAINAGLSDEQSRRLDRWRSGTL